MKNLNEILEYLSYNQNGSFLELQKKTGWTEINELKKAGFLKYDMNKNTYEFTEKGVDYYVDNFYQEKERLNIFKLMFD